MNERGVRQVRTQPAAVQPMQNPVAREGEIIPPVNQFNGVDYTAKRKADVPSDVRTGEIPGLGKIEFPEDHELVRGNRKH